MHKFLDMINEVSKHLCLGLDNLHYPSCVEALNYCMLDEGILQVKWCIDNIYFFYYGI